MKKFLIGFAGFALACLIAGAGYQFGKSLAHARAQTDASKASSPG